MKGFFILLLFLQDPSWELVRDKIALHESANGKYKIHVNANRTIDCGTYQINSTHFAGSGKVRAEFNKIFDAYGVGGSLHERVVAAITNDSLNESLARKLYEMRGLKSWTSSRKFLK